MTTVSKGPIRRQALFIDVVDQLRDMIVEGELRPGQRIAESALCEQFGISRTPMREALKVLASEGLIELLPNRGARVSEVTTQEIGELFEVVSGLERIAGELAVLRMTPADLEALRRLHERMESYFREGKRHQYFQLNHEAHNKVVELAGNSVLAATHAALMVRVRRARYMAILSYDRWAESLREHAEILKAFEARDGELAGKLIMAHVRRTGEVVEQNFDGEYEVDPTAPRLYAEP